VADPIRITIVDDHELFRGGLKMLLESEGFAVIDDRAASEMTPEDVRNIDADIVLIDPNASDVDGNDLLDRLVRARENIRIVVLSRSSDDVDIYRSVRAGARGFLSRDTPLPQLAIALRDIAAGGSCLSPKAAERLMHFVRTGQTPQLRVTGMSEREADVLRLLASGLENAQIGDQLGIKPKTVKNHVSHIFDKLDVDNRVQAAVWALRNGFA
jgi:DNA-binding NarL/FixJ family response regulator